MARLNVGDKAPDFSLDSPAGEVTLSAVLAASRRGVIVYVYPKAMTPGCTKEACDFRDSENSLASAGYSVIGLSPDSVASIKKFVERDSLNFPLCSDPEHTVMEAYGAWGEKKNYGKTIVGVIRSTFVIEKDGTLSHVLYNVKATGHVARLRRELGIDV